MKQFVQPLADEILQAAEEYVRKDEIPLISYQGYLDYEATGTRQVLEKNYFARRRQLVVLVLAIKQTPESTYINLLQELIWEICNEYSWSVPAHLGHQFTDNLEPATTCIDLFSAETAQALAETTELVGDYLDNFLVKRIELELERRIFQPFLKKNWFWETSTNNWSAVIAGSIGMAAIYQRGQLGDAAQPIFEKVDRTLQSYLTGFAADGACREGVGYWAYGFGYYLYYAELVQRYLKSDRYLTGAKIKAIAQFPYHALLDKKQSVPFSDFTESILPTGLVTFCRTYFGVEVPDITQCNRIDDDHCYRFAHLVRNSDWAVFYSKKDNNEKSTTYLSDAQWLLKKNPQAKFVFAAKGGHNDESHNHNDVGHFLLGTFDTVFLTDLGAGEYTKTYFQKERYDYLVNSSRGHSVPVINQCFQQAGFYQATAVTQTDCQFSMALEAVYPAKAKLAKFTRTFEFSNETASLLIKDSFSFPSSQNQVLENFVTLFKPTLIDNQVVIKVGEETCHLVFSTNQLTIQEELFIRHDRKPQIAYLIQANYAMAQQGEIVVSCYVDR